MMGSVTPARSLTSLRVSPDRRRAAASVAPMLTARLLTPRRSDQLPSVQELPRNRPESSGFAKRAELTPQVAVAQGSALGAGRLRQAFRERDQPGPQRRPFGPGCGAEDAHGEQARVAGPADRHGRDRM